MIAKVNAVRELQSQIQGEKENREMAFRVRVVGVPVQDGSAVWVVDYVLWWPVDDYIGRNARPEFRESVDSSLYLDHVGIFNKEEFIRLNDEYKASFLANPAKKQIHAEQQKRMDVVDQHLKKHLDTKWILVEQYEWESGMN